MLPSINQRGTVSGSRAPAGKTGKNYRSPFLGIESSPSFVRTPQGNGSAERFIRTLKEQLLWVRRFETVEALRRELLAFKERFNRHWLLQRHGHQTPAQVREAHRAEPAIAA